MGVLWSIVLRWHCSPVPVVIVSTEEGLIVFLKNTKRGCFLFYARFETLYKVLIPMASPAIITGLILAIARAFRRIDDAPLMLV